MEPLSSSFLQRNALTHSVTQSPPLLLFNLTISSVQIDENHIKTSHHKPILTQYPSKPLLNLPNNLQHKYPPKQTTNDDQMKNKRRKKKNSLLAIIFNLFDNFISDYIDPPLPPAVDPKHVLAGNFAPVAELPPTACTVIQGALPRSLSGAYIRNGPNPQFIPRGPYHLFDGDGMLHVVTISGGRATFCSRFVKTYKYNLEREAGSPVILNVFSAFTSPLASFARCSIALGRFLAGLYDPRRGVGGANTSLAVISGKLFAMEESDLPYRVKLSPDGDVITLGRHESFGDPYSTMTAHPKIDGDSGEAFAFRHSIRQPFLTYFRINAEGIKQPEVPIFSLNQSSLIHDFAITQNYAVFPDTQIVIKPGDVLKGKPPLTIDTAKVPRLGIIRRDAEDDGEMWWAEVAGLNVMHAANAWEEDGGDTIVMVGSNVMPVERVLDRVDLVHSSLERIEIDLRSKSVRSRPVSTRNLDFAVVNPAYIGKKNRYVYAAVGSPMPKIGGVVKLDLSLSISTADCTVARRLYPRGCYGGEPFFVAKDAGAEEDDGYLVTYVHDENSQESKFIVMDTKSPTLEIIATVKLPARVPYGFHGIFVPQSIIKKL